MDATYGDFISIRISSLQYIELTLGLSTEFEYFDTTKTKFNQFLFTKQEGGFLKFPYPYNAYMIATHTTYGETTPGTFAFTVTFEKNSNSKFVSQYKILSSSELQNFIS